MSNLAANFDKLETIFKEANAPVLQHFNPGLPEKIGREFLSFYNTKPGQKAPAYR
jgi:hypothetical protein